MTQSNFLEAWINEYNAIKWNWDSSPGVFSKRQLILNVFEELEGIMRIPRIIRIPRKLLEKTSETLKSR